ncbi:MAG: DUF4105 domain-containing protein [Tannerellaceae bacterium]|nr:DUF4105 domain-containing protein [Tannerellaceae bacterium]
MKQIFSLFLLLFLFPVWLQAQFRISDQAQISILTSSPSDDEVFTIYGHTGIRLKDPAHDMDYVFNYGLFDFSKPNFIFRFAKGETDYTLGGSNFLDYIIDYQLRGSSVTEQVLNLNPGEKQRIVEALLINMRPENRTYRYNFFFDNCATRPVAIVETYVDGEVLYNHPYRPKTFREMIHACSRNKPWLTFGCDLALGSPTDRLATQYEEMFLPQYLQEAFDQATIMEPDGTVRKLVAETHLLAEEIPDEETETEWLTPLRCGWLLFLVILGITYREWKKRACYRWLDCLLFFIAGLAGTVITFLCFISEHPATCPNWLLLWLHPFHLAGAIIFAVKKWKKAGYSYHFINFAALTLMLLGWYFIPQHLPAVCIPLVGTLWLRSAYGVYRYKSDFA